MDGQINKQITKRRLKHKDIKGTKHLQECSLQHYSLLQKIGTQTTYSPIGKWTNCVPSNNK